MGIRKDLLAWQWKDYPRFHGSSTNFVLHVLTVPLFIASSAALIPALVLRLWIVAAVCVGGMVIPLVAQGRGHKMEANPPIPFLGPLDLLSRFFVEQWVTFPRYALSRAFGAGEKPADPSR